MTLDWREPKHRQEVFLDFYEFHLQYRAHPGGVYYLMPYLRNHYGWNAEQALWFAFINGNTQNPITSLILHRQAPTPADAPALIKFYKANYERLAFDTDRRYHKRSLEDAVVSYINLVGDNQGQYWSQVAQRGFSAMWNAATNISTFGRLSAYSYLEYLRITGIDFDCDTLMLDDRSGSRSHRNGLCKVMGLDEYDWHKSNPDFDGVYPKDLTAHLADHGNRILEIMRHRGIGQPWFTDVSNFTLESALCTYKSWHRPNRRYPNVYNDMMYTRILDAQKAWPEENLDVFWEARKACLPDYLRLEDNPTDPGVVPIKQNHYLQTGEVIMMDRDFPKYANTLNDNIRAGAYGIRSK